MATWENTGASAQAWTRPRLMALALALAVITVVLTLSLIASRSTITQLHGDTARLHTELSTSRAVVSAIELRLMAAQGVEEGPFEKVRDHVVAKTAEFATPIRLDKDQG